MLHPAAQVVDQLHQGQAHRGLVDTGPLDVATEAVQLGTAVLGVGADGGKPVSAVLDDRRHAGQGLDVVDRARMAPHAVLRREGRLDSRVAPPALQRGHQRGLLAADVGPRAAVHYQFAVPAAAQDVLARVALGVGLFDSPVQQFGLAHELAANIDEADVGVDGEGRDDAAFENQVRVLLDQQPVLEGARLGLVGVDQHVVRLGLLLGHEGPLQPRGEAGAAATAQPGLLHLLGDRFRAHRRERLAQLLVPPTRLVDLDGLRVLLVDVSGQDLFHRIGFLQGKLSSSSSTLSSVRSSW